MLLFRKCLSLALLVIYVLTSEAFSSVENIYENKSIRVQSGFSLNTWMSSEVSETWKKKTEVSQGRRVRSKYVSSINNQSIMLYASVLTTLSILWLTIYRAYDEYVYWFSPSLDIVRSLPFGLESYINEYGWVWYINQWWLNDFLVIPSLILIFYFFESIERIWRFRRYEKASILSFYRGIDTDFRKFLIKVAIALVFFMIPAELLIQQFTYLRRATILLSRGENVDPLKWDWTDPLVYWISFAFSMALMWILRIPTNRALKSEVGIVSEQSLSVYVGSADERFYISG